MIKRNMGIVLLVALVLMTYLSIRVVTASARVGEHPSSPAEIVQRGGYNVLPIHEEVGAAVLEQVQTFLHSQYGDSLLVWTVQEADGTQHVFAYPWRGQADTAATGRQIESIVNNAAR